MLDDVLSDGRKNGLFLWIHLKKGASPKPIIETIDELQLLADEICPPETCKLSDKLVHGVGFGEAFLNGVVPEHLAKSFPHVARGSGITGMPNSGGDLFVHAKSDSRSNLFEFSWLITNKIKEFIETFNDIYGFVYKDGRDLSGFVDGTENPSEQDRSAICLEEKTGGSYCVSSSHKAKLHHSQTKVTQKWIHDLAFIASQSGTEYKGAKPYQIYRQSMPFGEVSTEAGLLFIAFANSTKNFDYMLDRMFGSSKDGLSDDIIHFTKCVQSNYWYFPSKEELKDIVQYVK
ncbi:iron dependent peroxidase [Trichuris trichiura]|uniref:Iron dependent peroxidase n=1 Tax=Trichuris trichiura TaxID=36087 RepID=A0A077Z6J2_TRITR|nr:iron dependent peroxidase [Trichuris trichiura]